LAGHEEQEEMEEESLTPRNSKKETEVSFLEDDQ
jgi:hypothetical protein